jgi:hypothetical protein
MSENKRSSVIEQEHKEASSVKRIPAKASAGQRTTNQPLKGSSFAQYSFYSPDRDTLNSVVALIKDEIRNLSYCQFYYIMPKRPGPAEQRTGIKHYDDFMNQVSLPSDYPVYGINLDFPEVSFDYPKHFLDFHIDVVRKWQLETPNGGNLKTTNYLDIAETMFKGRPLWIRIGYQSLTGSYAEGIKDQFKSANIYMIQQYRGKSYRGTEYVVEGMGCNY